MTSSQGAYFDVRGLSKSFGGITALTDASLTADKGQTIGIIGPNGAGKTTLLNCIAGGLRPDSGAVTLEGRPVTGLRADKLTRLGISRTFQTTEHFTSFTVERFVMMGVLGQRVESVWRCGLGLRGVTRAERQAHELTRETLDRFGLQAVAGATLAELSYGDQKRADMARAVIGVPRVLLLDEPTSGSSAHERALFADIIRSLGSQGITSVVVDHDVGFISRCCDHVVAMERGARILDGRPDDVLNHPQVIAAYMGTAGGVADQSGDDADATPVTT